MGLKTRNRHSLVAAKNILCYKSLIYDPQYGEFVSPNYRTSSWGNLKRLPVTFEVSQKFDVQPFGKNGVYQVNGGAYHAYRDAETNNFKCIIPKGANYYVSEDGYEFATDKLIIIRQLTPGAIKRLFQNLIDKLKWGV